MKEASENEGLKSPQEWARRVIMAALGEDSPISVNRSEFETAIAALRSEVVAIMDNLRGEIETLKELEPAEN